MAPKPIEDIKFPDLGKKIVDLLEALWIFICDLCLVVWSYVSGAFWTVWTYPPFERFRNEFVAALIALEEYVVAHPVTSMAIIILLFIVIPTVLNALEIGILHCMGFRRRGVLRGSYAANYQSTSYGGNVRRGSTSSQLQSQGAKGGRYPVRGAGSSSWH